MAFGIISVRWENHSGFQGCLSNQMPASQEMFRDEQISSLHTHTHTHEFLTKPWGSNLRGKLVKSRCLWVSQMQASLLLKAIYWGAPLLDACFQRWGASSGVPSLSFSGVRSGFAEPRVFLKLSLEAPFPDHRAAPEITHNYNSAQSGFFPGQ